jgi:hypothetical protein
MAYIVNVNNEASRLESTRGWGRSPSEIADIIKTISDLADCLSDLADCVSDLDSKVSRIKNR